MRAMRYLADQHRLSLHFRIWEFCQSDTADAHGIEIRVVEDSPVHRNLTALCHYALEPARIRVGPLHVTSGYRPDHVNELVGGVANSDHTKGNAADVWHDELTPLELAQVLVDEAEAFDQIILEHDQGVVHVGHRRPDADGTDRNRGEILTRWNKLVGHDADGEAQYTTDYTYGLVPKEDLA